jgi:hypothetical protein
MLSLFKKIKLFLFGKKTEIQHVEAALRRYKDELDDLDRSFDPRQDCCHDCKYGIYYSDLYDKIYRVELQLKRLKVKKSKK